MSATQFCMRACTGPKARENCQHIYDGQSHPPRKFASFYLYLYSYSDYIEMGCEWNMPASYTSGKFESCKADNDLPMGVYGTSTW